MRVFIALPLPLEVKAALERAQRALQEALSQENLRWTGAAQWHLTLQFLGEKTEREVNEIKARLESLTTESRAFTLQLQGVSLFGRPPRVIHVAVKADATLYRLHERLEPDSTRFNPHLTLARIKGEVDREGLHRTINATPVPPVSWLADSVVLYRSTLKPQGAEYTALETFPLAPPY